MRKLFDFSWVCKHELSSGIESCLTIDVEALSDTEMVGFSNLIAKKYSFKRVFGIPRGGSRLADCLKRDQSPYGELDLLIVDDVYTTGETINEYVKHLHNDTSFMVVVLFTRQKPKENYIEGVVIMNQTFNTFYDKKGSGTTKMGSRL